MRGYRRRKRTGWRRPAGRAAEDCLIAESELTEDVAAAPPAPETIH